MKINCGPSPAVRWQQRCARRDAHQKYLSNWHPFFCIVPRRLEENDCRWLEVIQRRGNYHPREYGMYNECPAYWTWEYKAL